MSEYDTNALPITSLDRIVNNVKNNTNNGINTGGIDLNSMMLGSNNTTSSLLFPNGGVPKRNAINGYSSGNRLLNVREEATTLPDLATINDTSQATSPLFASIDEQLAVQNGLTQQKITNQKNYNTDVIGLQKAQNLATNEFNTNQYKLQQEQVANQRTAGNLQTGLGIFNAALGAYQTYQGYKQLKLGEKAFKHSKGIDLANLNNSAVALKENLAASYRRRKSSSGMTAEEVDQGAEAYAASRNVRSNV